ncbi:MAG: dihydroxyacetone kinase phosphoryl donor subunit DhaM [Caldilineaceae bacterium]
MVNLVIVSHVQQLAEGVKVLAEQMAGGTIAIEAVGGVRNVEGQVAIGTDAQQIVQAIERCWTEQGVLLLVDLGSAVLSAELALELLPAAVQATCCISNAPLVEGAVVAAMEASLGHSLQIVNQAAERAGEIQKVVHG